MFGYGRSKIKKKKKFIRVLEVQILGFSVSEVGLLEAVA